MLVLLAAVAVVLSFVPRRIWGALGTFAGRAVRWARPLFRLVGLCLRHAWVPALVYWCTVDRLGDGSAVAAGIVVYLLRSMAMSLSRIAHSLTGP